MVEFVRKIKLLNDRPVIELSWQWLAVHNYKPGDSLIIKIENGGELQ